MKQTIYNCAVILFLLLSTTIQAMEKPVVVPLEKKTEHLPSLKKTKKRKREKDLKNPSKRRKLNYRQKKLSSLWEFELEITSANKQIKIMEKELRSQYPKYMMPRLPSEIVSLIKIIPEKGIENIEVPCRFGSILKMKVASLQIDYESAENLRYQVSLLKMYNEKIIPQI